MSGGTERGGTERGGVERDALEREGTARDGGRHDGIEPAGGGADREPRVDDAAGTTDDAVEPGTGASDAATPHPTRDDRGGRRGIRYGLGIALAVLFGLFFAYDVWEAVGNVVGVSQFAGGLGVEVSAIGWLVLVAAVVLPIVLFVVAFVLGRRRSLLVQAALYLVALAVSAVLYLDVLAIAGPGGVTFLVVPGE